MRILILHPKDYTRDTFFPDYVVKELGGIGELVWNQTRESFTEESLCEVIGDIDICIGGWVMPEFTSKVFDRAKKLKYIGQAGGSVKHYLRNHEAFDRGITVSNASAAIAKYVAEGALGLMLASLKNIIGMNDGMKEDKIWPRSVIYTESLYGKNVGLVGLGRVGRHLVDLLRPFGVRVRLFDPYVPEKDCVLLGIEKTSLEETLAMSEVISIHAASIKETEKLLGLNELMLIPKGALLVNTARAAIIDEDALLSVLREQRFSAALDVFWKEPLETDSEFRYLPNVILTPHSVAASKTQRPEITLMVIEDIKRFLRGETPEYAITKEIYEVMA